MSMRQDGSDELDDATIVRPAPREVETDDATIVRPIVGEVNDVMIVRPAVASAAAAADSLDDTASRPVRSRRRERRKASPVSVDMLNTSVALPVEDPDEGRRWGSRKQQGFDPLRHITPVPGSAPWEAELQPERGVRPETSVVYGPRRKPAPDLHPSTDQVHARLGDAPPARPVEVRVAREALPSLESRSRRSRLVTLIAGAAVLVISVAGLCVIAVIAFG